jgi:hypothetical protein
LVPPKASSASSPCSAAPRQGGVRTTFNVTMSTEGQPHSGVLPLTETLTVLSAKPGALSSKSYLPDVPRTMHMSEAPDDVHGAVPDMAPETVTLSPGTGAPVVLVTFRVIAVGIGQGSATQLDCDA